MRIVSLAPSNTDVLCELGASEELVATTSLCDHEKALDKPNVGGWTKGIDFDRVEQLEPDIVLTSDELQDDAVKELNSRDLETLQVKPHTLEEVYQSIRTIAEKVGKEAEAERLVKEMKETIGNQRIDSSRVYCEEWSDPPMVSGNWIPGLIEAYGGEYFIDEGERSREFSLEELKEFDPEYIFLNICGAGENISEEEVLEREGWQDITALKNDNVFVIDDSLLNRPSPSLVEGSEKIVEKIEE